MAKDKLQVALDADGTLRVSHRCSVEVGGHVVSHSEDIELPEASAAALANGLASIVAANAEEMAKRTQVLALQHAAALAGQLPPNTKRLTFAGEIAPVGELSK
jgi:hypothetical protein